MKRAFLFILLFACVSGMQAQQRVMLAVFAHPDDETFVGPVLARYAREGVKVYLAIATDGEKGVNEHAHIPGGAALAKVRHEEAACSCRQLGIEPPIFFALSDGELGAITNPLAKNVQAVADDVENLITKLDPDVIVTWGPDGGYGHPDHRLVSDAVTQVIQSKQSKVKLLYAALTTAQANVVNGEDSGPWHGFVLWHATDPAYLPVRVSFSPSDQTAFQRSLECHKSQFTAEEMQKMERALDKAWDGSVSFRSFSATSQGNDLFR
jgi:LmbE family N-acetylglucosaminyl deacetylase